MYQFLRFTLPLLSFALGPIFIFHPSMESAFLVQYVKTLVAVVMAFGCGSAIPPLLKIAKARKHSSAFPYYLLIVLAVLVLLGSLLIIRVNNPFEVFIVVVSLVGLRALARQLAERSQFGLSLLVHAGSMTLAGMTGFMLLDVRNLPVPGVISACFALLLTALELAWHFSGISAKSMRKFKRTYALLTMGGPCLLGLLSLIRLLPQAYLAVFLMVPLIAQLTRELNLKENSKPEERSLIRHSTGHCLLFMVIILLVNTL